MRDPTLQERFEFVQGERVRLGYENRDMRQLLKELYSILAYGNIIEEYEGCDTKLIAIQAIKDRLDKLGEAL